MNLKLNNYNILIRTANVTDINDIYNVEKAAYGKYHWSLNSFADEFKSDYSKYFVSEIGDINKIIGYIGYWLIGDEGHITTVAVDINFRRLHVADILLYNLIKDAQNNNIKYLTLEVRSSNIAALCLYNKFAFNQLGIRKKYYQDNNEDGIILWTEDINTKNYNLLIESIFHNINIGDHADILQ